MNKLNFIRLINEYLEGLKTGDYSKVRFSPQVRFLGPLLESPITGKSEVIEFLEGVSAGVREVTAQEYIIDGSTACILLQYETTAGEVLLNLDYIQVDGDKIAFIQPFFDPRPLLKG